MQRAYATKSEEEQAAEEQKKAEEAAQRQAEMDELERKKQEKKDRIAALQKQIADAKSKKEDVMGTKTLLDQRNQLLMEEIDDTKAQIDLYAEQIQVYQEMEEEQYAPLLSAGAQRGGAGQPVLLVGAVQGHQHLRPAEPLELSTRWRSTTAA